MAHELTIRANDRTNDSRLDSAWFGRGNKIKQDAAEILAAF